MGDERPAWSASARQRSFITGLIKERTVTTTMADELMELNNRDDFQKADATKIIQQLLELPKRSIAPGPVTVTEPDGTTHVMPTINDLHVSRFAIPVSELVSSDNRALAGDSDLLFGEVREWRGHKFINVLKGAPGDFNRIRLRGLDRSDVVRILAANQYKYTKLYGKHYSCCGCCGAPLTDGKSRDLLLGPECRKRYGL